jgi:hypothetical protein
MVSSLPHEAASVNRKSEKIHPAFSHFPEAFIVNLAEPGG